MTKNSSPLSTASVQGPIISMEDVIADNQVFDKLFSQINEQELSVISRYTNVFNFDKDTVLLNEGNEGQYLCLILDGIVEIVKQGKISRKNKIVAKLGAGMVIGEISMIDSLPYSASAITRAPTKIMALSRCDFDTLSEKHPEIGLKLLKAIGKIMGKRLRSTTSHLVDHFEQLTSMASAREDALTFDQKKSEYLSQIGYEIRDPLSTIMGYCDLLKDDIEKTSKEDAQQDLESILSVSKHLNSLINDMLDLSKVESGKMDLFYETFDVIEFVNELVTLTMPLMVRNNVKFTVKTSNTVETIRTDMKRTVQILINLLSNAAKFSKNREVVLNTSCHHKNGKEWIDFEIVDNGIGMTAEQQAMVFDMYSRENPSKKDKLGSSGLGLSLSQALATLMDGSITVTSKINEGSTFILRLPA